MSDFELLSLVLMILAIIIPLLIAYIETQRNNRHVPNKDWRLFLVKFNEWGNRLSVAPLCKYINTFIAFLQDLFCY